MSAIKRFLDVDTMGDHSERSLLAFTIFVMIADQKISVQEIDTVLKVKGI